MCFSNPSGCFFGGWERELGWILSNLDGQVLPYFSQLHAGGIVQQGDLSWETQAKNGGFFKCI